MTGMPPGFHVQAATGRARCPSGAGPEQERIKRAVPTPPNMHAGPAPPFPAGTFNRSETRLDGQARENNTVGRFIYCSRMACFPVQEPISLGPREGVRNSQPSRPDSTCEAA